MEAGDIPLGEESEAYQVEIAAPGGPVRRTATTTAAGWTYRAADLAADFAVRPAALDVTVVQLSAVAGPGLPARARLAL